MAIFSTSRLCRWMIVQYTALSCSMMLVSIAKKVPLSSSSQHGNCTSYAPRYPKPRAATAQDSHYSTTPTLHPSHWMTVKIYLDTNHCMYANVAETGSILEWVALSQQVQMVNICVLLEEVNIYLCNMSWIHYNLQQHFANYPKIRPF